MNTHPAYLAGRAARRNGVSRDANPWTDVLRITKLGTIVYKDEAERSEWACGWRDQDSDLYIAKHGRPPMLSDFVQRKGGRRWYRRG